MEIIIYAILIFLFIFTTFSLFKATKNEEYKPPKVHVIKKLKVIPQGRWMSDLFVITEEGRIINLKYDSETFAKLQVGNKISISEGSFTTKINILK